MVLYKAGGGSMPAVVAILGLFAGSAVYAEFHPAWVQFSGAHAWHEQAVTLPQLIAMDQGWGVIAVVLLGGVCCWYWWRLGLWRTPLQSAEGYLPLWQAALLLAGAGLLSVLGTGMPMGVTTSYAKAAAFFEGLVAPGHAQQLSYFTAQPIRYLLPYGGPQLSGGAGALFDVVALIQFPLIAGILIGAAVSAIRLGEFQLHWRLSWQQAIRRSTWALAVCPGSRMTPGCNVWHLLGGLPLLTLQSLLFLLGLLPGAWVGGQLLVKLSTR